MYPGQGQSARMFQSHPGQPEAPILGVPGSLSHLSDQRVALARGEGSVVGERAARRVLEGQGTGFSATLCRRPSRGGRRGRKHGEDAGHCWPSTRGRLGLRVPVTQRSQQRAWQGTPSPLRDDTQGRPSGRLGSPQERREQGTSTEVLKWPATRPRFIRQTVSKPLNQQVASLPWPSPGRQGREPRAPSSHIPVPVSHGVGAEGCSPPRAAGGSSPATPPPG